MSGPAGGTLRIVSGTHVAREQDIELDPDREPLDLEILLDRAGVIEGTVREADGEPLEGVLVTTGASASQGYDREGCESRRCTRTSLASSRTPSSRAKEPQRP